MRITLLSQKSVGVRGRLSTEYCPNFYLKEKEEDMWLITGLIIGVVVGAWIKDRKSWLDFLDTLFDKMPF